MIEIKLSLRNSQGSILDYMTIKVPEGQDEDEEIKRGLKALVESNIFRAGDKITIDEVF